MLTPKVRAVHLACHEDQVAGPANALFAGHQDVWLLVIDQARLPVPVRWEVGDPPADDGSAFPHLYAPLPADAVVAAGYRLLDLEPPATGCSTWSRSSPARARPRPAPGRCAAAATGA